MNYLKLYCLAVTMLCTSFLPNWATGQSTWLDKPESEMDEADGRVLFPTRYRTVSADTADLLKSLSLSPHESDTRPGSSNNILALPNPDSGLDSFRIVEYAMMEPGLANRYPEFKTYRGIHIRDPQTTVRIQWTERGFGAMVTGPGGRYFVDPYARGNRIDYISFNKRDYPAPAEPFSCEVVDENIQAPRDEQRVSGDCVFRSYRLAIATTGEYANFHGAMDEDDEDLLLSEVVIAVNRVNEVYERYVAIRMILIESTTEVFFYDGSDDPYSNNDAGAMLQQNQNTMNSVIGSANYDIGHVFGTGGGGVAQLYVPCVNNSKAKGVTGLGSPTGDPFYIDYVSHEMGHQYGGRHTQNNPCNRDNSSSYEPGSASTIMGYAGICSPNVQSNSDDYFHGISVSQINAYITTGNGNNCDSPIPWSNNAPVIASLDNYTIPTGTPFMLTADVSDSDGDTIYYLWEQWDPEIGNMPPQPSNTQGPMFRSFHPDTSPTRVFPAMHEILDNNNPTWEVLSSVARSLDFRATVFDFPEGLAGCSDEDNLLLTVAGGTGPFVVTSPNLPDSEWIEGEMVNVTWNVAGTNSSPINASTVDILVSTDGGMTFSDTLAAGVPNDGSETIVVPVGETEEARVMVKATNNVFFDISNFDFDIINATPDFGIQVVPALIQLCTVFSETEAVYTIRVLSINDFSDLVSLSVNGVPNGVLMTLADDMVEPGDSTTLTLFKLTAAPLGSYDLSITGSSTTGDKMFSFGLDLVDQTVSPDLITPEDGEDEVPVQPILVWHANALALTYDIQVAEDEQFNDIIISSNTPDTSLTVGTTLDSSTDYYWRVRLNTSCSENDWSDVRTFTTDAVNCFVINSSDVPVNIPSSGTPTVYSDLEIFDTGNILDVNVLDLAGTHTYMSDLAITLISPNTTRVTLFDGICGTLNNWDLNFDDEAASGNIPCPPTDGGTYIPEEALAAFDGEQLHGTWTLEVDDQFNLDGGALESWSVEVCVNNYACNKVVFNTNDDGPGSFTDALSCVQSGDTLRIDNSLAGSTLTIDETITIDKDITIIGPTGGTFTLDGSATTITLLIGPGTGVSIESLRIVGGSATDGSALTNDGTLTLRDITLTYEGALPEGNLLKNNGSTVFEGACNIER